MRTALACRSLAAVAIVAAIGVDVSGAAADETDASAEDKSAGAWTIASDMQVRRAEHGLVTLKDGRVLAVDGHGSRDKRTTSTCELYDPRADAWKLTAPLLVARNEAERPRLLLDGTVLLAGGHDHNNCCDALTHCEIYDPQTNVWRATGSMRHRRGEHEVVVLATGKVLVVGGFDWGTETSPTRAEIYDPVTESWSESGEFPESGLILIAVALNDGRVLVKGDQTSQRCYLFDPRTNDFVPTGSLQDVSLRPTLTRLIDGRILAVGGVSADHHALATVEIYDPLAEQWSKAAPLAHRCVRHTATLLRDGRVLVVGGNRGDRLQTPIRTAELYDPQTETWTDAGSMRTARTAHAAAMLPDGRVLVSGGWTGPLMTTTVEIFDPKACP